MSADASQSAGAAITCDVKKIGHLFSPFWMVRRGFATGLTGCERVRLTAGEGHAERGIFMMDQSPEAPSGTGGSRIATGKTADTPMYGCTGFLRRFNEFHHFPPILNVCFSFFAWRLGSALIGW